LWLPEVGIHFPRASSSCTAPPSTRDLFGSNDLTRTMAELGEKEACQSCCKKGLYENAAHERKSPSPFQGKAGMDDERTLSPGDRHHSALQRAGVEIYPDSWENNGMRKAAACCGVILNDAIAALRSSNYPGWATVAARRECR